MFNHLFQIDAEIKPFFTYLELFFLQLKHCFGVSTRGLMSKKVVQNRKKIAIIGPKPHLPSNWRPVNPSKLLRSLQPRQIRKAQVKGFSSIPDSFRLERSKEESVDAALLLGP